MDAIRRTSTLRRVATTASLAALLFVPAHADAAKKKKPKSPVITSVAPMSATVGGTLTIKGRHFRKGKGKNSVGFKREGAAVVFLKSDVSTTKVMYVKLSSRLNKVLYGGQPARFHLRVLASRFGKQYTSDKVSPLIKPRPLAVEPTGPTGPTGPVGPTGPTTEPEFNPAGPSGDCDGDEVLNKDEAGDIDNDLLSDSLEDKIGTDGCKADSDGDNVIDSYEYKSAVDLNDDEYQQPNEVLPYPGKRPYPNPLNKDGATDYDRDVLTLVEEYSLWAKQGGRAKDETFESFKDKHLSYSDGLQYSVYELCPSPSHPAPCGSADKNRRVPTLAAATYDKQAGFLAWAKDNGYAQVRLEQAHPWWDHANVRDQFDIRDTDRSDPASAGPVAASGGCGGETLYFDYDCDGFVSDDERDEDADGLTNYDEAHGRMTPGYWESCYESEGPPEIAYEGTDLADPDTDGDGIRDGADDQDHDDVPNMMELSRMAASHLDDTDDGITNSLTGGGAHCKADKDLKSDEERHADAYGRVQPFRACYPAVWSRSCDRHPEFGQEPEPNWWSLQ
jgi:hypothetical protein